MDKRRCLKGEGMMTKSNVVEIISALVAIIGVYVLINAPEMGSKATSESVADQDGHMDTSTYLALLQGYGNSYTILGATCLFMGLLSLISIISIQVYKSK
ncbi:MULTISPECIES: hypothetical protein [Bacillus cereus group]|uniref:Uncharacterized protein n=1 Tax=Bacillus mycoides TaxID=1405 RepID=A0AAP8GS66_BACMY|nr:MULTISPECIES: hypothetical protein [Bacillus cereus group]OOR16694.1 hypothetical protein BW891_20600 [Bacillus mycoides]PJN59942.1 hypothetical protein BACWE_58650 [Bacillus mycoides]PJN61601.1 hypothetical protein BAWEI_37650 [Bacillus mycoides]QWG81171.1 hypothetical protein EXW27_27745 [Bacillus mycoides]TXR71406.1 hypothetical protein DN408_29170 [Bacillus sp. AR13-1]